MSPVDSAALEGSAVAGDIADVSENPSPEEALQAKLHPDVIDILVEMLLDDDDGETGL